MTLGVHPDYKTPAYTPAEREALNKKAAESWQRASLGVMLLDMTADAAPAREPSMLATAVAMATMGRVPSLKEDRHTMLATAVGMCTMGRRL